MGKGSVMAGIKRVPGGGARGRKKLGLVLGLVAGVVLAVTTYVSVAYAALPATVQGVTPRGTTINLFDYWVDTKDGVPQNNGTNASSGINKDHALKFGGGNGGTVNAYTSSAQPRSGIVQNRLVDGYPALNSALANSDESLAYLFNPNVEESSRATHANVGGLLQVDKDGYYYYNSQKNFASYDADTSNFVLYNSPAVNAAGTSPNGQFFPFNMGTDVFGDNGTAKDINSNNSVINHYFGLTMQTNFVQQYGGHVDEDETKPVTYNFSGDDDVWVFIDGVLVGDLGGIHDATALQIDFSTGKVIIFDDNSAKINQNGKQVPDPTNPNNGNNHYDAGENVYTETTLKALFDAAHVSTSDFNGNTLPNNTYHTLSFFYMERGNVDSNMSLKYNLVNIPESGVMKVDAVGTPLNGVNFNLYPADSNYTIADESNPYTATTDSTGNLIFRHPDAGTSQGTPIRLDELGNVSRYWVLRETNVPAGYRSNGDVQLRFAYGDDTKGNGPLLVSNQWDSGAYSEPHVTVQADSTVTDADGTSHNLATGTMFAVVEKKVNGNWLPVYGDPYEGWQFAKDESASSLATAGARNIFTPGTSGAYEMTIENLPGDITTYEYMLKHHGGSANDAQYRVKYFYTTGDLTDADDTNTFEVNPEVAGSEFTRAFSVTVNISNTKNELTVKKVDEIDSQPLAGAEFTLEGTTSTGVEVSNTITTGEDGTAGVVDGNGVLPKGSYTLTETKAPENYTAPKTEIQIIVDDDGVHVNAGTAEDNVSVETGLGTLLYSMKAFAANDKVDATLHDITAQPQAAMGESYPSSESEWQNAGTLTHMQYNSDNDNVLNYAPTEGVEGNGDGTYKATAGWSRLNIQQCMDHNTNSAKTNLSELKPPVSNLNNLFTGDVTIVVTDTIEPVTLTGDTALKVTKEVKGADNDTAFTFTAKLNTDAGKTTDPTGVQGYTAGKEFTLEATTEGNFEAGDTQTASFDDVTFTKPGTYVFDVTEDQTTPNPAKGWTYDSSTKTITVTVTRVQDKETGAYSLSATTVVGDEDTNNPTFTNEYAVTGNTKATIGVQKTFTGRESGWGDDDSFQYTLAAVDNAPMPEGEDASTITIGKPESGDTNTAVFSEITYTAIGTYKYTVSEVLPEDDNAEADGVQASGVTYDGHSVDVTVSVYDKGDGTLGTSVTYDNSGATTDIDKAVTDAAAFTNTYAPTGTTTTPESGKGSISLRKVLSGKDWNGDSFSFTIAADKSNPEAPLPTDPTATVSAPTDTDENGNDYADFGWTISYDKAGTYVYNVTEVKGDNAGITYDSHTAKVTVKVTDNGHGGFTAAATVENGTFTNTYDTGTVNYDAEGGLQIVKNLTGHDIAADQFEFTLTATNDAAKVKLGSDTKVFSTTGAQLSGKTATETIAAVTGMSFTKDDAGNTFTFTVAETKGGGAGYTNDDHVYDVSIAVTDGGNGTLTVTTSVDGSEVATYTAAAADAQAVQPVTLTFNNSYDAGETTVGGDASVKIDATKTLEGRPMTEGEFHFTVSDAKGNTVATGSNAAAADGQAGVVSFPAITYSTEQLNSDVASGIATIHRNDDGTVTYQYAYTVSEDTEGFDEGVDIYGQTTSYQVTVNVTDDGHGNLTAAVDQGDKTLEFTNVYGKDASAKLSLNGNKALAMSDPSLTGPTLQDIAEAYTFTLTGSEGAPMPEKITATNDASGNVSFGTITYTMDNVFGTTPATGDAEGGAAIQSAQRQKTFTYQVTESGSYAGVTNDGSTKTVTVTVTDNGDGTLSVSKVADQGAAMGMDFTFTNTYGVEPVTSSPTGEGGVKITKQLTGRDLQDGEFGFQMSGVSAPDGIDPSASVLTATNDVDGNVSFGNVTFTKPGTYAYAISEIPGDLGGVTYDQSVYFATATVTDEGNGTLDVAWAFTDASGNAVKEIAFANTYQITQPASVTLGASKVLNGRDLKDGEFSFELKDADGTVLQTAKNAADGSVAFDPITYDELGGGAYTYTISEVLPEDDDPSTDGIQKDGVTYDETTYTVEVTVTDDGNGRLDVTGLTYNGEETLPVFTNSYTEPVEPTKPAEPTSPAPSKGTSDRGGKLMQTGDSSLTIVGVVLGVAVVAIVAGVALKKRG